MKIISLFFKFYYYFQFFKKVPQHLEKETFYVDVRQTSQSMPTPS